MKLQKLHIKNFKSLVDLEIIEPNPFSVFAGANGVGKSNIFEALEFILWPDYLNRMRLFGSAENIQNKKYNSEFFEFNIEASSFKFETEGRYYNLDQVEEDGGLTSIKGSEKIKNFSNSFCRYFIGKLEYQKINYSDNLKLNLSGSNLEKVLKRLLTDEIKMKEILGYLQLFIPEFEKIEVHSDNIGGTDTLLFYENGSNKPFPKHLISDGSYNILCMLTAVLQSDEPQFLCIEEPENGLTPYIIEEMVDFFRNACEEKGHYLWLNTHSQTLVRTLHEEELILVGKENGATYVRQFKPGDFHGMRADEARLNNALGTGLPW